MKDLHATLFEIFPAQTSNAHSIFQIEKEAWLQTYLNNEHGIERVDIEKRFSDPTNRLAEIVKDIAAQDENNTFFVAKDGDNVIGYCHAIKGEDFNDLIELYVSPQQHGKGSGSALMAKILSWFDPDKDTVLEVATYNDRAKDFYKRFGFEEDLTLRQPQDETWNILPSGTRIPVVFMRRKAPNRVSA